MSAEFVDALKGYEYYLKKRGKVSIKDINDYLVNQGRREIQLRTYNHYRKLLAHGFRSYIPINKFDVFQALGRIQMAADRRRYERETTQIHAKISRNGTKWTESVVIDKSLVGFGIATSEIFPARKGSKIWVRIDGYNDIPVMLVWRKHDKKTNSTRLGVRAFEFISKYQFYEEDAMLMRLTGVLQITREQEGSLKWEYIYRILGKTNELFDAVNQLIYSVDEVLDTNISLASPVLTSIKFGSPGDLQTKIDLGIAEILKTLFETFRYWTLAKKRYMLENRKLELENLNIGIEVVRNAINLRNEAKDIGMTDEAINVILDPIKTIFNTNRLPEGLFEERSLERAILTERVLPIVAEFIAGDDSDFKVDVYTLE